MEVEATRKRKVYREKGREVNLLERNDHDHYKKKCNPPVKNENEKRVKM